MIFDVSYWTRVFKRILYVVFILLGLYIGLKLSVFYMPFLVAFIISLMVEPAIKFIMRKTNLTRRTSSIIIFVIVSLIILGTLTWLIITLFSESSSLLQGLNNYFDKAYIQFQSLISTFNYDKIHLSSEVLSVIENSTEDLLTTASNWLRGALTGLINFITSLPSLKDLIDSLGGYLKAEATLILVSFIVSLIGLYILEFSGFNVQYPLLMALFIGFVDALPILRIRNSNDSMGYFMRY